MQLETSPVTRKASKLELTGRAACIRWKKK